MRSRRPHQCCNFRKRWTFGKVDGIIPLAELLPDALAGFLGIRQDRETMCLRPEIEWAVRDLPGPAAD
jgi:hypothetical protein